MGESTDASPGVRLRTPFSESRKLCIFSCCSSNAMESQCAFAANVLAPSPRPPKFLKTCNYIGSEPWITVSKISSSFFKTLTSYKSVCAIPPCRLISAKVTLHFLGGEQHGKGGVDQLFGWGCAWIESFLQEHPIQNLQDLLKCYRAGAQDMVNIDPNGPKFHIGKFDPGDERPQPRHVFPMSQFPSDKNILFESWAYERLRPWNSHCQQSLYRFWRPATSSLGHRGQEHSRTSSGRRAATGSNLAARVSGPANGVGRAKGLCLEMWTNLFEDMLIKKHSCHKNYQICILKRLCFLVLWPACRRKLTRNGVKLLLWQTQSQILPLPRRLLLLPHLLIKNECKIQQRLQNHACRKEARR